jgi:hypothetical protein
MPKPGLNLAEKRHGLGMPPSGGEIMLGGLDSEVRRRQPMLFFRRFISVVTLATMFVTGLPAQAPQPSHNQAPQQQKGPQPKCGDNGTYINSKGETVKRPENAPQRLKVQRHDATMEVTASVIADVAHVRTTAVSQNGCELTIMQSRIAGTV